jgi:cytochrome c-type biogenesis protein CcmH
MEGHETTRQVLHRRRFLAGGLAAVATPLLATPSHVLAVQIAAQDSLAGRGATGTLRDPGAAGRPRVPTNPRENDAEIQAVEQRLACNCGCTLDVFTCRTTDFTCTYSPALHREVLALRESGKTAQEILDAFVAKYGEKALMAPKPEGFNLAGYLLPGALIATAGVGLLLFIGRRKEAVSRMAAGKETVPSQAVTASAEELERLRRELADVED